jgi:hypothetical protein
MHAHPDRGLMGPDVAAEDLADADLGRPLRLVLVPIIQRATMLSGSSVGLGAQLEEPYSGV